MQREKIEPLHLRALASSLARHWTDQPVEFVRNFANVVYRIPGPPIGFLRLTPETHRERMEIESELQLIRHLAENRLPVSRPILSRSGSLIHSAAADRTQYFACVFESAAGSFFEELPPADVRAFFPEAGRTMALLHLALSRFKRPPGFARFVWTSDRWNRFAELVPKTESEAWNLYAQLRAWTEGLPTEEPQFGLIHGDFTIANMRVDGSRIAVFDFDAACDHWRTYEIATFLHYFGGKGAQDRRLIYDEFLGGYTQERPLSTVDLQQIPLFGKMRLLYSFLVFAEEWGFDDLSPSQEAYFDLRRRLFRSEPAWPEG